MMVKEIKKNYNWVPCKGLGPIKFGEKIEKYERELGVIRDIDLGVNDLTGWISYEIPNSETRIDTEGGQVVSVSSYENFWYKGKTLIDLNISSVKSILGCDPDEIGDPILYNDNDLQVPYEYYSLGLLLWFSKGRVVLASVDDPEFRGI
jgi:hypothetical protein